MLNHTVSVWAISQSKMIIYQSVKYKETKLDFLNEKVCHISYNEIKCIFVAFCNKLLLQNVFCISSFLKKCLEDIGPFCGRLSLVSKTDWILVYLLHRLCAIDSSHSPLV